MRRPSSCGTCRFGLSLIATAVLDGYLMERGARHECQSHSVSRFNDLDWSVALDGYLMEAQTDHPHQQELPLLAQAGGGVGEALQPVALEGREAVVELQ